MTRYNIVIYIVLIISLLYLSVNRINLLKLNNQLVDGISELSAIHNYDKNLANMEQNSWQIEKLLKEKENFIVIEKYDNSMKHLTDTIGNNSLGLYFCFHENSCSACLENEFDRIRSISDSFNIQVKVLCLSQGWRFIKILQQNSNLKNDFYRIILTEPNINEDLFLNPFYFIIDTNEINFIFVPIKENQKRTQLYFEFIRNIFYNRDLST